VTQYLQRLANQPWDHLAAALLAITGLALVVLSLTARSRER